MSDPRPLVGPLTERVYGTLPEVYRDADAAQNVGPNNYPLLRYLSLILDQLTNVDELLDRFDYVPMDERDGVEGDGLSLPPPWQRYGDGVYGDDTYGDADTSDLVDPYRADLAWLGWLSRILGVDLSTYSTPDAQREALANPENEWDRSTPGNIARLVRRVLDNPYGYVDTIPHYQGNPFSIAVVVKSEEVSTLSTWASLKSAAPTWRDLAGKWGNAELIAIPRILEPVRPAGWGFSVIRLESTDTPPPTLPVE